MNPKIDAFLESATKWREEMEELRAIALDSGLSEELKWGKPCFTDRRSNVAIIQPFKEQCAFMFFQGALLSDPEGLLESPGPNSQAGRRMTFTSVGEIHRMESRLRAFIIEAIKVEQAGLKLPRERDSVPLPQELQQMFHEVSGLKKAFESLTPGRQRAYLLYFSTAKRSETRTSRIEKCIPRMLAGKGPNE
jgi:uncharacterized protein YdeI (YjbR/CyaY-like superfamily)